MVEQTRKYYEEIGWQPAGESLEDLVRWEDLRASSAAYSKLGEERIFRHIPEHGHAFLDVGCGPLLHDELIRRTAGYREYHCVDFSSDALREAGRKLGERARCRQGDFMVLDLPERAFDCVVALACLFHEKDELQEGFVRKIIRLARPGAPVIVTYANPDDLTSLIPGLQERLDSKLPLYPSYAYYHVHPMPWWKRFEDEASIELFPLRTLRTVDQRRFVPDGPEGTAMLEIIASLEERHPGFFLAYGHYYGAVLKSRAPARGQGKNADDQAEPTA